MKDNSRLNKIPIHRVLVIMVFILTLLIMRGNESVFSVYSKGADMLDMRFGYDSSETYRLFRVLGLEGRFMYIRLLCIDFVFIASFTLVQNYLLRWIMGKAMLNSRWHFFLSLSYLRSLFDVIENTLILILIISFPSEISKLVVVCSFATTLKFILLGLWLIAIPTLFFIRKQIEKEREHINPTA